MLTINLLPQEYKKKLNQKIILSVIKNIVGLVFAAVIFIAIILLLAKTVSINNFNNAVEQAALLTKEYGGFNQQIRRINEQITTARQIQKNYIIWSDSFKKIIPLVPNEISLTYLSVSEPGKAVSMRGMALTRDSLLRLKSNLEGSGLFTKVEIPISYFLSRQNINFELSLATKNDAFK